MPMTDARLAALAKKLIEYKAAASNFKGKADGIQDKILEELDRRGTRQLETHGVSITKVAAEVVSYDYDRAEELLGEIRAKKLRPRSIDKDALAEAIAARRIDPVVAAQCSVVTVRSPYVSAVSRG